MSTQFQPAPVAPMIGNQRPLPPASGSRGFVVHNDFSAASQAPLIDRRGFVAAAASAGAIGESMQRVGGALNEMAMQQFRAINERKVLEAQDMLALGQDEIAAQITAEHDETKWEGIAQKGADDHVKKVLADKSLSPDARDAITARATMWRTRVVGETKVTSARRSFQLLGEQHNAGFIRELGNGNYDSARSNLEAWRKSGTLAEDKYESMLLKVNEQQRASMLDSARTRLELAYNVGDESKVGPIIADARKIPGVKPEEIDLMEQTARINAQRTKEVQTNKAQADLYGSLILQQAQGVVIVPAQIDSLAAAGKIDPIAAARLREVAQGKVGVAPGEFEDFITKRVMTYNPTDDANGAKRQEILKEFFGLGLSQAQAERFNYVWERTQRANATPKGRSATSLEAWARDHVTSMHKAGAFGQWKTPEIGVDEVTKAALADKDKMAKVLGVALTGKSKWEEMSIAEQIAKKAPTDPQGALSLFKNAAKVPQPQSGLDEGSYNYLIQATTKRVDARKEAESGATAARIQDEIGVWFEEFQTKEKRLPSQQEVRGKVRDLTRQYQDSADWDVFVPTDPAVETAKGNRITSFGYASDEWADSQSAKGVGAFTIPGDEETKLKPNDFAVSPDGEKKLVEAGVKPRDKVRLKLSNGQTVEGRWMDRTANDSQAARLGLKPLRGRWDLYSPAGKHDFDGVTVLGFETL